jgi:cobalt-zinc-cadmium efflux system outer membrane protein
MTSSCIKIVGVFVSVQFAAANLAALAEQTSSPPQTKKSGNMIAAGQITRPAMPSTQPIQPTKGTTGRVPFPEKPEDLFPPATPEPSPGQPGTPEDLTQPLNMGTIEYNENLAPQDNTGGLSVVQAMNEALVSGPRAAAVRAQFGIVRANYALASQAPNPILFMDRGLVAEQVNRLGPTLTQDMPWKLFFRFLSAKRLVAQTKIDLLTQLWSLRHDVRNAYVEVVVAQETQKTLEQLFELANRLFQISSKRFQAGDVAELDAMKARLAAAQAEVDVRVGRKRVLRAKQQLNILMGRTNESPLYIAPLPDYTNKSPGPQFKVHVSDVLPDYVRAVPPLQHFIDEALQNRLELKSLAMQVKVNKANLKGAYGNALPDPSLAFGKSTTGNPGPNIPVGPKLTAVFFTLEAEMPTANFHQGAIYNFRAIQNQLRYQIASQSNQILSDVSSAYNNLIAARNKIKVYQDRLLADSNEVARLARRSYEVGQSDITATLAAQQANVQTKTAYLDAINSYAGALTDLEFASGKPLQ